MIHAPHTGRARVGGQRQPEASDPVLLDLSDTSVAAGNSQQPGGIGHISFGPVQRLANQPPFPELEFERFQFARGGTAQAQIADLDLLAVGQHNGTIDYIA